MIGVIVIAYAAWNLWQFQKSKEEAQNLYGELAQQARQNAEGAPSENGESSEAVPMAESSGASDAANENNAASVNPAANPLGVSDVGKENNAASVDPAAEPSGASDAANENNAASVNSASSAEGQAAQPLENGWLAGMQEVNSDLAAWLRIPYTNIDYPVMQTEEDNDFYMNHDFMGKEQNHGTPFLDFNCDIENSENLIIYGHHMKDETMFQNLMKYKEPEFCENNGQIFFSIPERTFEYKVHTVMIISREEAEDFPYYKYIDLSDNDTYREYLKKCGEYSVWTSREEVRDGTPLLTLSTCEYSKGDGRLVVIASRVTE